MKPIKFFDTTLRDGEQTPGVSLNTGEKIEIARHLEKMGVNVIEAGFAASSKGDFDAVSGVSKILRNTVTASLSRALKSDIDASFEALREAVYPRIHVFIATSDIHMKHKLKMEPEAVYRRAVESVAYAKSLCNDIEFSAEDATRSDMDFLCKIIEGTINAGATTVNIPDTVGYTTPDEYFNFISEIRKRVPDIDKAEISVHCHNDLGMAVSNSLAAISAGATQVECTINGLGERGGNAAFEEIIMALETRKDIYAVTHTITTAEIMPTSRIVTALSGIEPQAHKPIVGRNAFVHASGIHQHGVLANKATYEIISPEKIGLAGHNNIVLGKLSGRHAFEDKLKELDIHLSEDAIKSAFALFKETADRKKTVTDMDIMAIANEFIGFREERYLLEAFQIQSGNRTAVNGGSQSAMSMVTLTVKDGNGEYKSVTDTATGSGPVDASFNAINRILSDDSITLESYGIKAATEGMDALGVADVKISKDGVIYKGIGTSTDIIEASIRAYVNAVNNA